MLIFNWFILLHLLIHSVVENCVFDSKIDLMIGRENQRLICWLIVISWDFTGDISLHSSDVLALLQHPFIYPIMYETFHEAGCLIMHQICPSGSLKDRIYKAKPLKAFHREVHALPRTKTLSPGWSPSVWTANSRGVKCHSRGWPALRCVCTRTILFLVV